MNKIAIGAALLALAAVRETVAQEKKSWTDNLSLSGDARFRFQNTEEEGRPGREWWRFRARLALRATVSEEVSAGLRLVTNTGNPVSDTLTMSGAFDDKDARLDRAFILWTPAKDFHLTFGKMGQPWISVSDLIFSGDVNPEGLAARATLASGENASLLLHGGAFILEERSAADETSLFSGQAAVRVKTGGKNHLLFGSSLYAYQNVEGFGLLFNANNSFGNSTRAARKTVGGQETDVLLYATDYTLVEGFVEAGFDVGAPLVVGAQYVVNTAADEENAGYLGTLQIGRVEEAGTWAFGYQYRHIEKDAILGVFGEFTDFFRRGADLRSHVPFVQYAIARNFDIRVQYAMGQMGLTNGRDVEDFKIDLSAKF